MKEKGERSHIYIHPQGAHHAVLSRSTNYGEQTTTTALQGVSTKPPPPCTHQRMNFK